MTSPTVSQRLAWQALFERGEHALILAQTLDKSDFVLSPDFVDLIIGALSFQGRGEEAEILLSIWEPQLSQVQLMAAYAFRVFALARLAQFPQALRKLRQMRRLMRGQGEASASFFYHQARAFYAFCRFRLKDAVQHAEQALGFAFRMNSFWARALAMDVKGHLAVLVGEVQRGLSELEKAHHFFGELGHGQNQAFLDLAMLGYRLQHKPFDDDAYFSLPQMMRTLHPQANNFSLSFLHLEYSHQLALRGKLKESETVLSQASRLIESYGHHRQRADLLFHQAYRLALTGQSRACLQVLMELESLVVQHRNEKLLIKLLGLKADLGALSVKDQERLRRLVQRSQLAIPLRIQARREKSSSRLQWAQDPMADLLDHLQDLEPGSLEQMEAIFASGLLSFLWEALRLKRQHSYIVLHLRAQTLCLFDAGEVIQVETKLTEQMDLCLQLLAQGPQSKASLVFGIWSYDYHPLRHDSLLYGLIYRLRSAFAGREHWIEADGEGYRIKPGVQLRLWKYQSPSEQDQPVFEEASLVKQDLNARQYKILQYLRQQEWISLQDAIELCASTKVTASRDLSQLTEKGYLQRVGKARNTSYRLAERGGASLTVEGRQGSLSPDL